MSYRPKTNFRNKDAMERGDPYKRVRGSELQDEFEAISRAVATQGSQIENIDNSVENIINNGGGGGPSGPVAWDDVTGKPSTYPPEAHNHDGEYLKDFTEEDPTVPDHVKSISEADIDGWNAASSGTAPVTSVNTKTGAVVLDASDVGALPDTFAEEDPTVPDHVKSITQDDLDRWDVAAGIDVPVTSVNGMDGDVTLTASDVGALPDSTTIPPAAPVDSVNSKTGAVVLSAADVGALPDTYSAPVDSVNGQTGAVTLSASDVGALPDSTTIPPAAPVDSVNGKTGAVTLSASDVGAQPSGDYSLDTHNHDGVYQPAGNYLTSYTETDPVFSAHVSSGITQTDIDKWNSPPAGGKTYSSADGITVDNTADTISLSGSYSNILRAKTFIGSNAFDPSTPSSATSLSASNTNGSKYSGSIGMTIPGPKGFRATMWSEELGDGMNAAKQQLNFAVGAHNAENTQNNFVRMKLESTGELRVTGPIYKNNTSPVMSSVEMIQVLTTIRRATRDETSVEGLRDAIGNAIGGLIEKFEAMQSEAVTQEIPE